jgi:hypothetical protein
MQDARYKRQDARYKRQDARCKRQETRDKYLYSILLLASCIYYINSFFSIDNIDIKRIADIYIIP